MAGQARKRARTGTESSMTPSAVGATAVQERDGRARCSRSCTSTRSAATPGRSVRWRAAGGVVKGVESVQGVADPVPSARELARRQSTVVAITGKRRHPFRRDTGARCRQVATSAENDHGHRLHGHDGRGDLLCGGIGQADRLGIRAGLLRAGRPSVRLAERKDPGSFRSSLLDELYHVTPALLGEGGAGGGPRINGWPLPRPRRLRRHTCSTS